MQKRQLGTSEIYISPIIMGTWQAGKSMWVGIEDAETVKAIVGARHGEQARENAKTTEVKLSGEELKEIDAIGRTVTDHLDDNPVMWEF